MYGTTFPVLHSTTNLNSLSYWYLSEVFVCSLGINPTVVFSDYLDYTG